MSNRCKYLTSDKLSLDKLNFKPFHCDDMSVTKSSDKTYSECKDSDKDHPCFGYLQVYYLKNPMLYITTPKMKCLFGVQNRGNANFQMSLQFTNLDEDPLMKDFFNFIQHSEYHAMKSLGLNSEDSDRFVSQIQYDKKEMYEPNLNVKLPFQYNQFLTDIYSEHSSGVNIFNIRKFQNMECDLYVDRIWRMNDKFYMKWKCKVIHLI